MSGEQKRGGDLFIVDNADSQWKVRDYLREWSGLSHRFDIATGSFEIGGLLAIDGHWQQLDKLRILIGAETTLRTRRAFEQVFQQARETLDQSIEEVKEGNDFLKGVPAIVEALRQGTIECRVYRKDKFHAKAYITHSKLAVVGSAALVGSSNFTHPGLTQNVELNVQIQREVEELQAWFEQHWEDAEAVSPEILEVIERHTKEYSPFVVYAKALEELVRGHELTANEWEKQKSGMYHHLDRYQQEGYHSLLKIARQHNGAFLCDGVGLGKTFVGMMLIERLIKYDKKNVLLLVPKAAGESVWAPKLKTWLPELFGDEFNNLVVMSHTDLSRTNYEEKLARVKERADAIVIDEAHNFRNPGTEGRGKKRPSRYRALFDLAEGKQMFMLTATPINNSLRDLQHQIELFTQRDNAYFGRTLGINSLPGHFRKLDKAIAGKMAPANGNEAVETELDVNMAEVEDVLKDDPIFTALVVQRSRSYVRQSQDTEARHQAIFPDREAPQVASYSVKATYGDLLKLVEDAFHKEKPLFALPIYYPLAYYEGSDQEIDPKLENRQKQVVGLIRIQFLKRFESSPEAFKESCVRLLGKLEAFVQKNSHKDTEDHRLYRWKHTYGDVIEWIKSDAEGFDVYDEDAEDIYSPEMLEDAEELPEDEFNLDAILGETILDMYQLCDFLRELKKFQPKHDDKLQALLRLLKKDKVLKKHKILLFTEYQTTAKYLKRELEKAGITGIGQVDSTTKENRADVIRRFSPYYNESSSGELAEAGVEETRILIATDVLSEGLNLQDATRLINYDLHWNPVRLMQRIGRVDRRMDPAVEERIVQDHPDQKAIRGNIAYWNFLPPDELDRLLRLYTLISHKVLKISKTFGIEGKRLLTPEDDYEALRNFVHEYEGEETTREKLHLEYQRLLQEHPDLEAALAALPLRAFSGKPHPEPGMRGVFLCYSLPALDSEHPESKQGAAAAWTEEAGRAQWYYYDLERETHYSDPAAIAGLIRSDPDTPRLVAMDAEALRAVRLKVEKHIKNDYLKRVQAPVGVKPVLKAWMAVQS